MSEPNNQEDNDSQEANQEFQDAVNEFEQYFANEHEDDDEDEDDDFFYDEEEEEEENENIQETNDDYENEEAPLAITYNTELPSSHNYLGQNFQEVSSSKQVHDSNEEIQIPILPLPGNSFYENDTDNNVQLIPGQVMPIYFYSSIQIQVIRRRLGENKPTIGFTLCPMSLRILTDQNSDTEIFESDESKEDARMGILAEILSASYQNENNEITDFSSLIESAGGLILKVKGKERFRILSIRKDITGSVIGTVKILPEYCLDKNPLILQCFKHSTFAYESYLHKTNNGFKCSMAKAEFLNSQLNQPAWVYRYYDCNYLIYLIQKELAQNFKQQISNLDETNNNNTNSLAFCSWLLTNFPFDNKMRINCLKMNCINQRLIYMYKLLRQFTNISCRLCLNQFCTKADVFSISKQGFMSAFLNPGGVVHETLTVYKIKNFHIMNTRPSTQHSWFPGYGWQIITCGRCNNHIGWKFTRAETDLKPEKFFGLTRKAIRYTYNEVEEIETENQAVEPIIEIAQNA